MGAIMANFFKWLGYSLGGLMLLTYLISAAYLSYDRMIYNSTQWVGKKSLAMAANFAPKQSTAQNKPNCQAQSIAIALPPPLPFETKATFDYAAGQ